MSIERIKEVFEKTPAYGSACTAVNLLEAAGFEAYIVGGAVRDALLNREIKDFDLSTNADPEDMLEVFKDYKVLNHGIAFGTLGVVMDKDVFEITTYRGESDYNDQRHPDKVEFIKSKDEDLKRRDFTINAMMFHPKKGLYDPFGGHADLQKRIIRTVGDPKERFKEDSLRIVRMMRFSVSLGFEVEGETLDAAKGLTSSLGSLSKERIFSEMEKALSSEVFWKNLEDLSIKFLGRNTFKDPLGSHLNVFEKAYVISRLRKDIPSLNNYVLSKELKKSFNLIVDLEEEPKDKVEVAIIKFIDQINSSDERLRYIEVLGFILHERGDIKVYKDKIRDYPSGALIEDLDQLKSKLTGRELGDAILKAKKDELFLD